MMKRKLIIVICESFYVAKLGDIFGSPYTFIVTESDSFINCYY